MFMDGKSIYRGLHNRISVCHSSKTALPLPRGFSVLVSVSNNLPQTYTACAQLCIQVATVQPSNFCTDPVVRLLLPLRSGGHAPPLIDHGNFGV